jgi:dipeptidyl aminopeptidase/acylaminoacyl peptidase
VSPCATVLASVYDLEADSVRTLVPDALGVWYAHTGHLLYAGRTGGLYAMVFDPKRLETRGGAIPVLEGVKPWEFTISASGDVLYSTGASSFGAAELVWVSHDGRVESADVDWHEGFGFPAISPDGERVALSITDQQTHLWIKHFDGGRQKHTFEGINNWRPHWTPDGSAVTFLRTQEQGNEDANGDLWIRAADGSRPPELLLDLEEGIWEAELSRDGEWLVFRTNDGGFDANIYARRITGDTTIVPLVTGPTGERGISLSPDGRWLAYSSEESGQYEVYVISFPDASVRQLVSRKGGVSSRWSPDGQELFFRSAEGMMVARVLPGSTLSFAEPELLFEATGFLSNANRRHYDITPDGQRFLMIRPVETGQQSELVYVENWTEELRARMAP